MILCKNLLACVVTVPDCHARKKRFQTPDQANSQGPKITGECIAFAVTSENG